MKIYYNFIRKLPFVKPYEIYVYRKFSGKDHTGGELHFNGKKQCFILEDEKREVKVMGETRIPAGRYKLELRTWGGHHDRYKKYYDNKLGKGWHEGMIWLRQVPNFKYILIHCGNDDDDTGGCLLTGLLMNFRQNFIGRSRDGYEKVYPKIVKMIKTRGCYINVIDEKQENANK